MCQPGAYLLAPVGCGRQRSGGRGLLSCMARRVLRDLRAWDREHQQAGLRECACVYVVTSANDYARTAGAFVWSCKCVMITMMREPLPRAAAPPASPHPPLRPCDLPGRRRLSAAAACALGVARRSGGTYGALPWVQEKCQRGADFGEGVWGAPAVWRLWRWNGEAVGHMDRGWARSACRAARAGAST